MFNDREAFPTGINNYVPAMQYSNACNHTQVQQFSLGSPAAASATAYASTVAANAAVGTTTTIGLTTDSTYGRTITLAISGDPGAALGIYDVRGNDYLGQPMLERFTGTSGSTAILYGQKAFKYIRSVKIVTAATNAVTFNIGSGTRLGLPYRGDVVWAKEAGTMVPVANRAQWFYTDRSAAQAVAGGSNYIVSPFAGYVKTLSGQPGGGGSTTNPVITVELANVAITGLTVTVDTDTSTRVTDTPTTAGYNANNRFVANGAIEIVGAAAASAGADIIGLELQPTQFSSADTTDPATSTTADPRGTYEAIQTLAATEIIIGMYGDNAVNASNNGGLHGIRHYYA